MPFFRGKKKEKEKTRKREGKREREEITKMRKTLMNIVLTPVNNLYAPAALDERVLNSYNLLKYCEINMSTSFPQKCSQQVEFKQEHTVEQSKSNLNQTKQKNRC